MLHQFQGYVVCSHGATADKGNMHKYGTSPWEDSKAVSFIGRLFNCERSHDLSRHQRKRNLRAPPGQLVLALTYLVQSGSFCSHKNYYGRQTFPYSPCPCHRAPHRARMQHVFTSSRPSAPPQGNLHHSHRECRTPHRSRIHRQSPRPLAPSSPHPQGVRQLPS